MSMSEFASSPSRSVALGRMIEATAWQKPGGLDALSVSNKELPITQSIDTYHTARQNSVKSLWRCRCCPHPLVVARMKARSTFLKVPKLLWSVRPVSAGINLACGSMLSQSTDHQQLEANPWRIQTKHTDAPIQVGWDEQQVKSVMKA